MSIRNSEVGKSLQKCFPGPITGFIAISGFMRYDRRGFLRPTGVLPYLPSSIQSDKITGERQDFGELDLTELVEVSRVAGPTQLAKTVASQNLCHRQAACEPRRVGTVF